MDREHFAEFSAVREAARDGLCCGRFVVDMGWPLFRFVVLPSFENSLAWDVPLHPVRGKPAETRLFRSCWRMDLDARAFGSPVERLRHPRPYRPTIEVTSGAIDAAEVEELIDRFRTISIPLAVAAPQFGCDGTSYQLETRHSFCHARIGWWERLPNEWEALATVVEEMVALFESSCPNA
jgi:hypothetical protein